MSFLHDTFSNPFAQKEITRISLPGCILDNLKSGYGERPYQVEAFKRFVYLYNEDFDGKPSRPYHLLYNMATGSGKTLIMAGLILYLYEKGYRNFLFFVNSNNIIKKTKDNFLNSQALKYLFRDKIVINSREIYIKETEAIETSDKRNINIKFTTIQQLHTDLNNTKENSVTYEDFTDNKAVLIADEAHHLSSATKNSGNLFGSWEGTVLKILHQNTENILLEFTATLDYDSREIVKKYENSVIFKYDLAQFRLDKYSKEINLMRSFYDEKGRIVQALILNLYRQELASANNINLKPVILFKAKKTIRESEQNKANFHNLIDEMSGAIIEHIRDTTTVAIIHKAFTFFDRCSPQITAPEIAKRIKSNFKFENCISANNDAETEQQQIRLNTLEDESNPVRAVFAVQKLNEGWDVLNLYDIVRLYEGQHTGGSNITIGATTISEAQLIGRGARYFPFALENGQDKFTRKYDNDPANDLKILEELYYHTKEDSRYISELKKALIESGIYTDDDKLVTKKLLLKTDFKETEFYKTGRVVFNRKIEKNYTAVKSFADLGVSKKNFTYILSSGAGRTSGMFNPGEEVMTEKMESTYVKLSDIPKHIVRHALSQNPFFYFSNLTRESKCFPNLVSITRFIEDDSYLNNLEITFSGCQKRLANIANTDYLLAMQGLLNMIEYDIKASIIEYEGSSYKKEYIRNVFTDKEIRVPKDSERSNGQESLIHDKSWYVYSANYGTSEEKAFVEMFEKWFPVIQSKFKDIYLIRNEREVKMVDKRGRTFEPDYILFCKQKKNRELTYQVFIEPKGNGFIAGDKWKEEFLKSIRDESKIIKIDTGDYLITAVPFYNNANENEFKKSLTDTLEV